MPTVREGCNLQPTNLALRIRGVLRDMTFLSESRGSRIDTDRVSGGTSKSTPPSGVRFGRRDLRDLSLAEYWSHRFNAARGNERTLEFFLYLAERDLRQAKVRIEPRDPHETLVDRAERIVTQYEGLSPLEAAVAEDSTEMYIRSTRINNEREPETGWPK